MLHLSISSCTPGRVWVTLVYPFCILKAGPLYRALHISAQRLFRASFKDQKYWFEAEAAIALLGIFHLHDTKTSRKKKQDRPQNSNFAFLK